MASWNTPSLTQYIRHDVPALQVLLHAAARWNPEDATTEILTDIQKDFKRITSASSTDTTINKTVRFETYDDGTWKSVGKLMHDVDMLDGYHASKSSFAENFIPVYNSKGKIVGGAEGESGKAIQLTNERTFDIGGIASADAQTFNGTQDVNIPINSITVNNEGDTALVGIVSKAHGGTGNANGYASDVQMTDATGGTVLALGVGQLGESKLVNSTDIKSLIVPGNYISRTVNTDYGFPYTDSSMTAYINVSKQGNSIIQRINMGGNNLWVNTSNDGGRSWLGLKPIGGSKQGSLTIYVSKSGSALNSGFDPASPILSIEHAIQIFYDFGRGVSNAECKLCVGEGDWGSFTFRGLPFDLNIYPFDGLPATKYTNSLPIFHSIVSSMGTVLHLSGVVVDAIRAEEAVITVNDYCRIGSLRTWRLGHLEVHNGATVGVFSQALFTDSVLQATECGRLLIRANTKFIVEENIVVTQFAATSSGAEIYFLDTSTTTFELKGTVTGKKFYVGGSSKLSNPNPAVTWDNYIPGTMPGVYETNAIINGSPFGGGDPDTFLCADLTWKKVTTLPSLNVTGDTVLNGKLTVKGDFIIGTTSFLDKVYPVGSIYMSVNSTSPATLFGGTWEEIAGGRVLMGANSTYTLGSTGGSYTHTLSADEMPSHTHTGSSAGAGGHSHSFGSMNIWGSHPIQGGYDTAPAGQGAFYYDGSETANSQYVCGYHGWVGSSRNVIFSANQNWAGAVSTIGDHTHGITIGATGSGQAHNNIQPYLVVKMWKRTA